MTRSTHKTMATSALIALTLIAAPIPTFSTMAHANPIQDEINRMVQEKANELALSAGECLAQKHRNSNYKCNEFQENYTYDNRFMHDELNGNANGEVPGPSTRANQIAEPKMQPKPRCTHQQDQACENWAQLGVQAPYMTYRAVKDAWDFANSHPLEMAEDIINFPKKLERAEKMVERSEELKDYAKAVCADLKGCELRSSKRTEPTTVIDDSYGSEHDAGNEPRENYVALDGRNDVDHGSPVEDRPLQSDRFAVNDGSNQSALDGYEAIVGDEGYILDDYEFGIDSYGSENFGWYDFADENGIHTQSVDPSAYGESNFGGEDPFGLDLDELNDLFDTGGSDFYEGEDFNDLWEEAAASQQYEEVQVEDAEQRTAAQEFFGDFEGYSNDDYSDDYEDRRFRDLENARFAEIKRELESLESAIRNNEKAHVGKNVRQMLSNCGFTINLDGSVTKGCGKRLMPNSTVNRTPNRKDPRERAVRLPPNHKNPNLVYSPVATPESIRKRKAPPTGGHCIDCTN